MPCNSDYMEPNEAEKDSRETAKCLEYALTKLDKGVPPFVKNATGYYGEVSQLNSMVILLCSICENMSDEEQDAIIYDGRNPESRNLAAWWDRHQEADRKREENEGVKRRILIAEIAELDRQKEIKERELRELSNKEQSDE